MSKRAALSKAKQTGFTIRFDSDGMIILFPPKGHTFDGQHSSCFFAGGPDGHPMAEIWKSFIGDMFITPQVCDEATGFVDDLSCNC